MKEKKKICLIKPPTLHKGASFALMPAPPLGLAYIAAVLKKEGYDVQVIDASAEGVNNDFYFRDGVHVYGLDKETIVARIHPNTELICFAFMFTNNWLYDRELVHEAKAKFPEATLIAGGEHSTAAPDLCFNQSPLDFIVLGEGEDTIAELVNHITMGNDVSQVQGIAYRSGEEIIKTVRRKRKRDIKSIPWPAWDLFPLDIYFKHEMSYGLFRGNTLPVMATRGCPYECTFCSNPLMWGRAYEMRPPSDFVDELEYLNKKHNVVNFDLFDLTAIISKKWILEMCEELISRNLNITYQLPSGTRSEAIDFEVAQNLFKSGCKNITYAPESGSAKVLKDIKKKVKISSMLESIGHSCKAGMNIKLNMIIGFPDDTHADIWKTIWFLIKCSWYGANDMAPAIFSPYPGSELFERLQEEQKVNVYSDEYILEIINSYDFWPNRVYSNHINSLAIKLYVLVIFILFYGSNYLFRPQRFFITIKNVLKKTHESRLEQALYKNFFSNFLGKKRFFNFSSKNVNN